MLHATDRTVVGIRGSPQDEKKLQELRKVIKQCDQTVLRILRSLGIDKVTMPVLKRCVARTPPNKRAEVAGLIKKIQAVVKKRQEVSEEQLELSRKIAADLKESTIAVKMETFSDVIVQVGEEVHHVEKDVLNQVFYWGEEGIESRSG